MINSTGERILYALKSRGPLTVTTIGDVLEITPQGAQQQLAKLVATDLITSEDRKKGRGRPNRFWHLTEKGHARFPDRHSDLTVEILQATEQVFGAEGLEQLVLHREKTTLQAYTDRVSSCKTLESKISALADMRSLEGYMAEWEKTADGAYMFFENHCPICAAATECQGLCRSEMAIFQAVFGQGVATERREHILQGARRCAYHITIPKK